MNSGVLTYGNVDEQSMVAASRNFAGAGFLGMSFCCTPIELLSNDGEDSIVSTASGFFWLHGSRSFLITNWHVLSGRNPFTNDPMSSSGFVPTKFSYYGFGYGIEDGKVVFTREKHVVTITDVAQELLSNPPVLRGAIVDVYALEVASDVVVRKNPKATGFKGASTTSGFINEHIGQRIVTRAGDDCFILGYPLTNYAGLNLPVWKRGSIASDTSIGVDNRPIFLVDAATTSAMSGSPIIRKAIAVTVDNRDIGAVEEFASYDIIGIYAGRLQSKDLSATNIGYGWYQSLIPELIELLSA
ncbi:hypothetical protein [Phyllobacterium sp. SB3]|uniref:hypothetical protein n=1 Tax=Phyllobacterium sp. SB3 TaxID=3156073 RepID=UPI0032AFE977